VAQINSVYDSIANVIIVSTRILGCSEENTAKPKLRNTWRLDYILFSLLFLQLFYFISLDAVIICSFVLHYFYNAKNYGLAAGGPPAAGGPCHGTNGTMVNPALDGMLNVGALNQLIH